MFGPSGIATQRRAEFSQRTGQDLSSRTPLWAREAQQQSPAATMQRQASLISGGNGSTAQGGKRLLGQ